MNFKKTLLASLLMISASGAFAADNVALTVIGKVTPASCDITIGGGSAPEMKFDVLDYRGTQKTLPAQKIAYEVSCPGGAKSEIAATDSRTGTKAPGAPSASFGLGTHTDSSKIGWFTVSAETSDMRVDSKPGVYLARASTGGAWGSVSTAYISPNSMLSHKYATTGTNGPDSIELARGMISVEPTLASGLSEGDEINLDGSVTLTVSIL